MLRFPALVLITAVCAQPPVTVKGRYRHPGQGFSILVPGEATGLLEGHPAVNHGIRLVLPSGGSIFVYGEANSLEFPTPADGIRSAIAQESKCSSQEVRAARVGDLSGAGARLTCGEKSVRLLLVFRPGGGPIYWLRLETQAVHETGDSMLLQKVARSFQIIPWK